MKILLIGNRAEELQSASKPKGADFLFDWAFDPAEVVQSALVPNFEEENSGNWVQVVGDETRLQEDQWATNYYQCIAVPTSPIRVSRSDAVFGNAAVGGNVIFLTNAGLGSAIVFTTGAGVACNTVFDQVLLAPLHIRPTARQQGRLTPDLERLSWDMCRRVLTSFARYAKEILDRKEITITETRIRNWQAIEDTNWKQCILDLTVKAELHIALSVWDELTEELQKFTNKEPEVVRTFLENKLSIEVKWV